MTDAKRKVRSYVIRTGRMTTGQRRAIEKHWIDYGLEVEDGPIDTEAVFGNDNPVVVEIGFGMGDSLADMAESNPALNFIGIEVHRPGIGHLLHVLDEGEISNVRIYCADAIDVLRHCMAPDSIDRIQILFPDPWPKKRHHKRRLINADFADLMVSRLARGGILHIATDWPEYADEIMETMAAGHRLRKTAPPPRPPTKYERRGRRLGHDVRELAWCK